MSDTMLFAVLGMPREMREHDHLSRIQFDAKVQEAISELDKRAKRIEELEKMLDLSSLSRAVEAVFKANSIYETPEELAADLLHELEGIVKEK